MSTDSSKQVIKKKSRKLGKLLGAANMIFSVIPDTVEIVSKITDKTAPIVDKHLERQSATRINKGWGATVFIGFSRRYLINDATFFNFTLNI